MTARGSPKKKPRTDPGKRRVGKAAKEKAAEGKATKGKPEGGSPKGPASRWRWVPSRPGRRRAALAAAIATGLALAGAATWFTGEYVAAPLSVPYRPFIEKWARGYRVDPYLVAAVLECESSGRARAVSSSGALGLMQLMPRTARECAADLGLPGPAKRDLFDPELNVRLGTYYLSKLHRRFGGDRVLVLAAYHAGPTRIADSLKRRGDPPGEELLPEIDAPLTRAYVRKAMARREELAGAKR